jgi:hypothetical protein
MPKLPAGVTRDEFALATARLDPFLAYRWLDDATFEWRLPAGTATPPTGAALLAAVQAVRADAAAAAQATQQRAQARATLRATAQAQVKDLVGKNWLALGDRDRTVLLLALLVKLEVLDQTLAVRPVADWL